uniref:Putative ovule protein n=1 Tax=Solanum chacoense TaxID=4108 RepID=A0A0V0GMF3_SOLCH
MKVGMRNNGLFCVNLTIEICFLNQRIANFSLCYYHHLPISIKLDLCRVKRHVLLQQVLFEYLKFLSSASLFHHVL